MPFYNTATAAAAIGVTAKWLDNLLTHHKVAGVQSAKQGVPRRLSTEAIGTIAVAHALITTGKLPTGPAVELAHALHESPRYTIQLSPALTLTLDPTVLAEQVGAQLADAVEITPTPSRGRPPLGPPSGHG